MQCVYTAEATQAGRFLMKSYSGMLRYSSFEDRLRYLELHGSVGEETFGPDRYLNQRFYTSSEWKIAKRKAIVRDCGRNLAVPGLEILGKKILVHHIEPIGLDDILEQSARLLDLENLVCVTLLTHDAIHYGWECAPPDSIPERFPGDTKLW